MRIEKRSIMVNHIKVMLHEAGNNKSEPPLILLHGGGLDSGCLSYGSVISTLGEKYHVIIPDLPGYGETEKPEAPYTMEWYLDFLRNLIEVLGYNEIYLGGLSLGGGISLGYSLENPNKVKKLVLIAPYGLSNKIPYPRLTSWLLKHPLIYDSINKLIISNKLFLKKTLKTLLVNPDAMTDEIVAKLITAGRDQDSGRAWRAFQLSEVKNKHLQTCFIDQLQELKMPVILFTGKNDSLVPSKDVKKASSLITQSKLVEIENCGHWLPRDRSVEFIKALQNFL